MPLITLTESTLILNSFSDLPLIAPLQRALSAAKYTQPTPIQQDAIPPAMAGRDAVLTALGPHGTGPTTISQDSVRSIIQAMQKTGARRLITVSGSIVTDEGESRYIRCLLKPVVRGTFLRHVCADMRNAEAAIRDSSLDWTIMRPPGLTSKAAKGTYRTAIDSNLPHGFNVSRADLAACMLTLLGDPAAVHRHIGIAN